jgi:cation diffusion facilitator CzcD-associated flavoprotein CzcO
MSFDQVQTLIIGGGQAGLAMSHMLSRRGCSHRVVERGRIAERWRSERWEGLCFLKLRSPAAKRASAVLIQATFQAGTGRENPLRS